MNSINKVRIRNFIIWSIVYAEMFYQAVIIGPSGFGQASGRVRGPVLGIAVSFILLGIVILVGEYREKRSVRKAFTKLWIFIIMMLSFDVIAKKKYKYRRLLTITALTCVVLLCSYDLLSAFMPTLYDEGIAAALIWAAVASGVPAVIVYTKDQKGSKKRYYYEIESDKEREKDASKK